MKKITKPLLIIALIAMAAFCFVGCASTEEVPQYTVKHQLPYVASYAVGNYQFLYAVDNQTLTIDYTGTLSTKLIAEITETVTELLPTVTSFSIQTPGQLSYKLSVNPNYEQFAMFVIEVNEELREFLR